jgi:cell division protein FtsW
MNAQASSNTSSEQRSLMAPMLVILTMFLVSFGLIMVFSAGAFQASSNMLHYFSRQLVYVGMGMLVMIFLANYDYSKLSRWARPMLFFTAILLMLVLFSPLGVTVNGGRRWLNLPFLPLLQPSEIAKLAIVLYLADCWTRREEQMRSFFKGIVPNMAVVAVVLMLILKEPDKSTTMLLGALVGGMWFIAGGRKLHLFFVSTIFMTIMTLVICNSQYAMKRVLSWIEGNAAIQGSGYQVYQAKVALAPGGITGLGLGEGLHKMNYIPFPHTDFILAVIGEELGFLATTGLAVAFVLLTYLGIRTAAHAADRFGYLLASGATLLLAGQALLNMGVVIGMLPNTGITLPFISYGGSSMIISLAAVGLIINVSHSAVYMRPSRKKAARAS